MPQQTFTIKVPKDVEEAEVDTYVNDCITRFMAGDFRAYPKPRRPDQVRLHPFSSRHFILIYDTDHGYKTPSEPRRDPVGDTKKPTSVAKV